MLGFFFANFFNRPRTATIVGYILVIAGVMVAMVLELLEVREDLFLKAFIVLFFYCLLLLFIAGVS